MMPTMKVRAAQIALIVGLTFAALAGPGWAQTPASLPPAAQELLDKGLIAARIPDYLQAIGYFEQARAVVPRAPEILYNLGLAESKIPGRELRAICWLEAYLDISPKAANATAVKQEIDELDVKSQSNLSRFIRTVQDAVNKLPPPDENAVRTYEQEDIDHNQQPNTYPNLADGTPLYNARGSQEDVAGVAALWIEVGDMMSAKLIVDGSTTFQKIRIAHDVVENGGFGLGLRDTLDKAKSILLGLGDDPCNASGSSFIDQVTEHLRDNGNPHYAASEDVNDDIDEIAYGLASSDDIEGALTLLTRCKTKRQTASPLYPMAWVALTQAQVRKSDFHGALASLAETRKYEHWTTVKDQGDLDDHEKIAELQAAAGDYVGAQATADMMAAAVTSNGIANGARTIDRSELYIFAAQAVHGDVAGARKTASRVGPSPDAQAAIAEGLRQLDGGHISWSSLREADPYAALGVQTNSDNWTVEADTKLSDPEFIDLAGFLKSKHYDNPNVDFDLRSLVIDLISTGQKLVGAQKRIDQMLKDKQQRL